MSVRLDPDQLRASGFVEVDNGVGMPPYWSFRAGPNFELTVEPLTFGRWQIALYERRQLIMPTKLEIPSR